MFGVTKASGADSFTPNRLIEEVWPKKAYLDIVTAGSFSTDT